MPEHHILLTIVECVSALCALITFAGYVALFSDRGRR